MKNPHTPVDDIFLLNAQFERDPRKNKVNAGIGIYLDPLGKPYVHPSVKLAIKKLNFSNFNYLPLSGDIKYLNQTAKLVLGNDLFNDINGLIAKQGTIGGTNGIYIWAKFIKEIDKRPSIIIGSPTWENHIRLFQHLGFRTIEYPHLNNDKKFNLVGLKEKLDKFPTSYVLLQAGPTHNPTGINPSQNEWEILSEIIKTNKQSVLFDFAYLGLGDGIDSDCLGVRLFSQKKIPTSLVISYSKNMTLYQHRAGALLILTTNIHERELCEKLIQYIFRLVNSNPAGFSEQIVKTILGSQELTKRWKADLSQMQKSLAYRRELFRKNTKQRFDYLRDCRGLFALLDLSQNKIQILKKKHAIYILPNGRINFGGISSNHISRVSRAVLSLT